MIQETKETIMIAALETLAKCEGKTIPSDDVQYEKGANAALSQCAGLAREALKLVKPKEKKEKADCYKCEHKGTVPGSCHSSCNHPEAKDAKGFAYMMTGESGSLHIEGDDHGIKSGWFCWPLDFDPIWLKNCDGFEKKGNDEQRQS